MHALSLGTAVLRPCPRHTAPASLRPLAAAAGPAHLQLLLQHGRHLGRLLGNQRRHLGLQLGQLALNLQDVLRRAGGRGRGRGRVSRGGPAGQEGRAGGSASGRSCGVQAAPALRRAQAAPSGSHPPP